MGLFDWLFVGHLVGDYILQTRWMAENKAKQWFPLTVHSAVYTAATALLALIAGGLSVYGISLIFFFHLLVDRRHFISFWASRITQSDNSDWLKIVLDQSWHILILAIATLI